MIIKELIRSVRSLIYDVCAYSLSIVSRVIPKNKHKILFFSTPDYSDNSKYVYRKMVEMGYDKKYQLIWCVSNPLCVDYSVRRSFKYFYDILSAKYIISTHGAPRWKSSNQVGIELWHGLPLKTMGYLWDASLEKFSRYTYLRRLRVFPKKVDVFITTSNFERMIFSSIFMLDPRKIFILGQPRGDALYLPLEDGANVLCRLRGWSSISNKKLIFYLPTFREYDPGMTRSIMENILTNNDFHKFLKDEDIQFICKPHIKDEEFFRSYDGEQIHILLNEDLKRENVTLYDFLNAVDILITDYSSVYFDYLLLNRPIVFYVPDLEEYQTKRGFILEPFDDWTPGDKAGSVNELIQSLDLALNDTKRWECERLRLKRIIHQYDDGNSSERVCNLILGCLEY